MRACPACGRPTPRESGPCSDCAERQVNRGWNAHEWSGQPRDPPEQGSTSALLAEERAHVLTPRERDEIRSALIRAKARARRRIFG